MSVVGKKNTDGVNRLHKIAGSIDELDKDLDRVEFLEDEIVDKRALATAEDMVGKVRSALTAVRTDLGKKAGSSVARGYKK